MCSTDGFREKEAKNRALEDKPVWKPDKGVMFNSLSCVYMHERVMSNGENLRKSKGMNVKNSSCLKV